MKLIRAVTLIALLPLSSVVVSHSMGADTRDLESEDNVINRMPRQVGGQCTSNVVDIIVNSVTGAIAKTPARCCNYRGPTAVFVTHGSLDATTTSGFEPFWHTMYSNFVEIAESNNVCFVMTGYNSQAGSSIDVTMRSVLSIASLTEQVPVIMLTDPTGNENLVEQARKTLQSSSPPLVGVFNTGFENVVAESLVSGLDRIPYIGITNEGAYGELAASAAKSLLPNDKIFPICLNSHPEMRSMQQRCESFSDTFPAAQVANDTRMGIPCTDTADVNIVANFLNVNNINAIFAHEECCMIASRAAEQLRATRNVVVGCMDKDSTGGKVNFITKQAVGIQAWNAFAFTNLPLQMALMSEPTLKPLFPSLSTQVSVEVFNEIHSSGV